MKINMLLTSVASAFSRIALALSNCLSLKQQLAMTTLMEDKDFGCLWSALLKCSIAKANFSLLYATIPLHRIDISFIIKFDV